MTKGYIGERESAGERVEPLWSQVMVGGGTLS